MLKAKKIIALMLAVVLILGLAACGGSATSSSQSGQTAPASTTASTSSSTATPASTEPVVVNVAIHEEQVSLDNVTATKDVALMIAQNVFETLYCYDENFNLQHNLAESEDISADGLKATINLRKGVKFHNGNEMTAKDVVASMERFFEFGVKGKGMAPYIDSVEADGDYSVVVNFTKPYSVWQDMFAWYSGCWYVIPAEIAEAAGENALGWDQNIGTGPFKFDEYQEGRYIKLSKYDDYVSPEGTPSAAAGKREVFIDELYFHLVEDSATRLNGLMSGQYDYVCNMPTDYYETINSTNGIHTVANAAERCLILFFNTHSKQIKNPKMRQALAMAMNCTDAMQAAYGNPELWNTDTTSWYPEGSVYYYPNDIAYYNKNNAEEAKKLAQEAGYKGEEIRLLFNSSYPTFVSALTIISQNLKDAGFNVVEDTMDNTSLMSKRSDETQWEIFVTHHNFLTVPTTYNPLNAAYAGWWDTAERNEAVDAFIAATSESARVKAWKDIVDLMNEQAPVIRLGGFVEIYAASDKLEGVGDQYWAYPTWWNVKKNQ